MKDMERIIETMESEMVTMWSLDEATHMLKVDPEYIKVIIRAIFYEREHFRALGMVIGEA